MASSCKKCGQTCSPFGERICDGCIKGAAHRELLDAERRAHEFFRDNKIMFIKVGAFAREDRIVPMYASDAVGNVTGIDDEYDGILQALVAAIRGEK